MSLRNTILILAIFVLAFCALSCSSGGSEEKKPTTQQDQNVSDQTQAAGEQPAREGTETGEGTPLEGDTQVSTVENEDGTIATTATGEIAVTEEDGTTKVYDSSGNVISSATGTESTPGQVQSDSSGETTPPSETKKEIKTRGDVVITNKIAILKTNFGDMYLLFYPEIAPNHVRNFIYLSEKGFYKKVKFHRIMKEFMAQAGIPREDWDEPIQTMNLEAKPSSNALHLPGALSAARTDDPNSATSQFFIVFTRERTKHLDGKYTVFGQVFKGFDVLKKLENVKLGPSDIMSGEESKPMQDIIITDVVIEDAAKYKAEIDKVLADNAKILEKERGVKPSS